MDRYDKNIGTRKSKLPMGCPAHPMNITGNPGTCSGPPGASQRPPTALKTPSQDSPKPTSGLLEDHPRK